MFFCPAEARLPEVVSGNEAALKYESAAEIEPKLIALSVVIFYDNY